ncbi:MAG: UvrD-helicase domain-containing protein [Lachnospiraceae bacterium]|nr:UvrD-helicase domain-containing protein [Lachnospiraceae bacterium]
MEFYKLMQGYLRQKRYIAKSDYASSVENYRTVIDFFAVMEQSGMMENFCSANRVTVDEVRAAIDLFVNAEAYIDQHNDEYVALTMEEEKEYLDHILKDVDPNILLDEDQRKVVLTDEDYCMVIAGAGAGKTTTVAAKVKYLVEKKEIQPSQILVVSFTNKAVDELKEKIQKDLGIDCHIATFHSVGNEIIQENTPEEKLNIVDNSRLYFVIRDYFRNSIMQNESMVNKLIMFLRPILTRPTKGMI